MEQKTPSLSKKETAFVATVWKYYEENGRHDLPWRKTHNPYHILVSELMLQQTQVARVIPKYKAFLKQFGTVQRLANASLGEVLVAWQGLGYNRRAKFLWLAAQAVVVDSKGKWPKTFEGLKALPGVGEYTAGAVMCFAYNQPARLIETNIRTVYIHHFFADREAVPDAELAPLIDKTTDTHRPREWGWALMDYGSYLKSTVGNLNKKSKMYQKQSDFKTSNRYVRGAILKAATDNSVSLALCKKILPQHEVLVISEQLKKLVTEGLLIKKGATYQLP